MTSPAKPHLLGMVAGLFLAVGLVGSASMVTTSFALK